MTKAQVKAYNEALKKHCRGISQWLNEFPPTGPVLEVSMGKQKKARRVNERVK